MDTQIKKDEVKEKPEVVVAKDEVKKVDAPTTATK